MSNIHPNTKRTITEVILDDEAKKRIIEIEKLTIQERFALDAYIVSREPNAVKTELAYTMSRKKAATENKASLEQLMYRWIKKPAVKYYIEDRTNELFAAYNTTTTKPAATNNTSNNNDSEDANGQVTNVNSNGNSNANLNRSKDETLAELNLLATTTRDAKLKAELLMKIAELQQWKKQETQDEETRIKYYMPLKCSNCELYKRAKMSAVQNQAK